MHEQKVCYQLIWRRILRGVAMLSPENRIIPRASDLIFLHPLHPDVNFEPRAADFALSVKLWDASYSVFVQVRCGPATPRHFLDTPIG